MLVRLRHWTYDCEDVDSTVIGVATKVKGQLSLSSLLAR